MAYTLPIQLSNAQDSGVAIALTPNPITATGAMIPFALPRYSGIYWGQVTFQCLVQTVTTLTAKLQIDLTGVDANFTDTSFTGINLFANPVQIFNLNGGNARYRWNIQTFTDGGSSGAVIYAIAG